MKLKTLICIGLVPFLISCATDGENKNTVKGAGIGAAVGGLAGAVLGHQMGKRNEGALIGAGIGAVIGGHAGRRMDKQAKELEKLAETKRTDQGLVAKLKSDILFDTGKTELKPAAKANIKQMAEIMKKYPENVLTIEGYTDSTGSAKLNEELSQKRAEAVKAELIKNGMPAETINTKGLGPANPVADNKTATGRQQNRRVEIQIQVDESKVPPEQKQASI